MRYTFSMYKFERFRVLPGEGEALLDEIAQDIATLRLHDRHIQDMLRDNKRMYEFHIERVRSRMVALALGKSLLETNGASSCPIRLSILGEGVTLSKVEGDNIWTVYGRNDYSLEPGAIIRGKASELASDPLAGGRLEIASIYQPCTMTGLVDPETGQPRVHLEILEPIPIRDRIAGR